MEKEQKPKMGRPSIYSQELADRICELVATHPVGLPKLCKMFPELPNPDTIRVWRWQKDDFSANYTKSKQFQAEIMAESIEDILDDTLDSVYFDEDGNRRLDSGILGHARLRIDSRKWTAGKLAPKIYGDRQHTDVTVKHEQDLKDLA